MIEPALAQGLRALLDAQRIASLGTLHEGEPFVSMVPFAMHQERFVIHVSGLAAHTRDMLVDARVSLMIAGQPDLDTLPQAVPRVTVQGAATRIDGGAASYAGAGAAYLARFPESEPMFGFGDFALFEIAPRTARFVGGFAQAKTVTAATLGQLMQPRG